MQISHCKAVSLSVTGPTCLRTLQGLNRMPGTDLTPGAGLASVAPFRANLWWQQPLPHWECQVSPMGGRAFPGSQSPTLQLKKHPRSLLDPIQSPQNNSFHPPSPRPECVPSRDRGHSCPLKPKGSMGMGNHILAKQISETKHCGHHITLFLWFSNFTLGQGKLSLPPAWPLCDPSLKMGLQLQGDAQQKGGIPSSQPGWQRTAGSQQVDQAPTSRDSGL